MQNQTIEQVATILKKYPSVVAPALMGSNADDTNTAISDIDLLVVFVNDDIAIRTLEEDMELLKQKAVNAPSFDTYLIPGANHGYDDKEKEFAEQIVNWVKKLKL